MSLYKLMWNTVRGSLNFFFRIFYGKHRDHEVIVSLATYAPWRRNKAFRDLFNRIRKHTMLDIFRLYELWSLTREAAKIDGDILEVGVWRGGSGVMLAGAAREYGIDATVFLCDTFTGVVKAGSKDGMYKGGEHSDTSVDMVRELAGKAGACNIEILQGIFPEETGNLISDRTFRLVHIDVDVYDSTAEIVDWVWSRMPSGGIIVMDDYGSITCSGITTFMEEQRGKNDRTIIYNLNGHGIIIKR
jgi:O-methyltransferase